MNDGWVNFKGQKAPLNQPSENADFDSDFKPGLWYNMPKVHNSHTCWIALTTHIYSYFKFYDRLLALTRSLPDGDSK